MAWIESHQTLKDHPKTLLLCKKLKVKRHEVIGYLHMLWWWCIDYAPAGDLSKFTPDQIALACETEIDPDFFMKTLEECGFIERIENTIQIHDWHTYCGALMERRLKRMEYKRPPMAAVRPPTVPDLTVPNRTRPKVKVVAQAPRPAFSKPSVDEIKAYCQTKGFNLDAQHFWDHYEANGWRVGRNPMKNWQAAVGTWMRSEFRTEGKHGTNVSEGIPGLDPEKIRKAGYSISHSGLRKVPPAGEILNDIRNLPVPVEDRQ